VAAAPHLLLGGALEMSEAAGCAGGLVLSEPESID
jgi:hypothetical protein